MLTEINEISNSSDYQEFYDIDFETSGIALDLNDTIQGCDPRNLDTPLGQQK